MPDKKAETPAPSELDALRTQNEQLKRYVAAKRTDREILESIERQIAQLIQGLANAVNDKSQSQDK